MPAGVSFAHLPETYYSRGRLSSLADCCFLRGTNGRGPRAPCWPRGKWVWRASAFGLGGWGGIGLYIDGEPDKDGIPWDSAMAPLSKVRELPDEAVVLAPDTTAH